MYRRMMYVAVVILGLAPMSLVYGYNPGSPDLLAWWTCDEGDGAIVGDASGNGRDGAFVNGDPAWVEGISGSSVQLVGPTLVEVPPLDMELTEATMAGWIKPNGAQPDWSSFIMTRTPGLATGFNVLGYQLAYHWNDTSSSWSYRGGDMIAEDDWTFAAVTVAPDKATFYVNGVPGSVNAITHEPCTWNSNIYLGGDGTDNWVSRRMNGALDDVSLFSRALTADEILAVMEGVDQVDMEIGFAIQAPVIDGQADAIWAGASTQTIVPVGDPADASGSWKALYDSENLYVIVEISDESLMNDSSGSWQDDSVEFYFDGGNSKLNTPLSESENDYQFTFGWGTDEIQGTNISGATDGVEQAQVDTDTGWRIEIKLPWMTLQGAEPQARDLIGIDCFYNDDDDGGDSREDQIWTFATNGSAWNDASQWGTAMLAIAPEPVDPGTDNLVAYYALENDVLDGSGNEIHGAIVGDPNFVEGPSGMALTLDGVDDLVDLGNPSILDFGTGDFTISAWINMTATERGTVYAKGGDNSGGIRYTLAMGESNDNKMTLTTDDDSDKRQAKGDTVVNDGAWHHVVGMRRGMTSLVFVDGYQEGTATLPFGYDLSGSSQANALIGAITDARDATGATLEKFFAGTLDEVALYDRALSGDEILYLAGFRAPVVNLLANGGFEDGVMEPWSTYGNVTTEVVQTDPIEGDYCLHLIVPEAGANFWDAGLQHTGHVFEAGKNYTLSAYLKSSQGTLDINFKPELGQDPWTGYGEQAFTMTEEWAEYSITTGVLDADVSPATITFHIAYAPGDFFVDDVKFVEVK